MTSIRKLKRREIPRIRGFATVSVMAASIFGCNDFPAIGKDPDRVPARASSRITDLSIGQPSKREKREDVLTVEEVLEGMRGTKTLKARVIPIQSYEVKGGVGTAQSLHLDPGKYMEANGVKLTSLGMKVIDGGNGEKERFEFIRIEGGGESVDVPMLPLSFCRVSIDGKPKLKLLFPVSGPAFTDKGEVDKSVKTDDSVWIKEYPEGAEIRDDFKPDPTGATLQF